jgi:hypothetical protein
MKINIYKKLCTDPVNLIGFKVQFFILHFIIVSINLLYPQIFINQIFFLISDFKKINNIFVFLKKKKETIYYKQN